MNQTATTAIRLTGRWLRLGRLLWAILFLLCLTLLLYSLIIIPPIVQDIRQNYSGLEAVIASLSLWRRYLLVIAFYATSLLVFRQRSHELGPLIMSGLYAGLGSVPLATGIFNLTEGVMAVPPLLDGLAVIVLSLGVTLGILSVYVFPDGRFVPAQAVWVSIPICLMGIAYAIGFYTVRNIPMPLLWIVITVLALGVVTQVYRYRHKENLVQRQQVKWYVYGVVAFMITQPIAAVMHGQIGPLDTASALLRKALVEFLFFSSYLLVLLTNLIAIIRYRLFDINYVINRSIVFAGLTVLLGGLFAGVFFGLQLVLDALIGGEQPVISAGAAGALVIMLFQPTRRQVRRLVDHRLYGIELDYTGRFQARPMVRGHPDEIGMASTLGSFKELILIGRGGMGEVYRAIHPTQHIPVAVKLLKDTGEANAEARRRFRREAQTIARLKHPHIVALHEIGEHNGMLYMIMEYVAGKTVSQLLREKGKLPLPEVVTVLTHVAAALDYAHEQAVIHRDIKPPNVMIETETGRAVLMDFGIAKIAAETQLTQSGGMIGTLDYISPEQIQGEITVDQRADIYSLGVMSYQMLTGELPFKHNNAGAMVMAHLMQPPPDPRDKVPELPASVAAAVKRAMSKKPEDRFATAGKMAACFEL